MKTRHALGALALAALLAACGGGGGTDPNAPINVVVNNETTRLIVFGDSLSDAGTYSRANSLILQLNAGVPKAAADLVGKFTNSPGAIWPELLATRLGISAGPERWETGAASPVAALAPTTLNTATNATIYAQGGSRVAKNPGVGCTPNASGACTGQSAVPVTTQIDRALAKGNFTATDLVVIWAGANDAFFQASAAGEEIAATSRALGRAMTTAETTALIQSKYGPEMVQAALDTAAQVRRVRAAGAQRVLVMTFPNAALSPFGVAGGASTQGLITALAGAYNDALKVEFSTPQPGVLLFDAGALVAGWYTNPASVGFVNVQAPVCNVPASLGSSSSFCFVTGPTPSPSNPFLRALPPGVTPDNSMFADGVHPSLKGHSLFANVLYDTLKARAWVK
jgi:phospholipase/lecithinase/hemolysin